MGPKLVQVIRTTSSRKKNIIVVVAINVFKLKIHLTCSNIYHKKLSKVFHSHHGNHNPSCGRGEGGGGGERRRGRWRGRAEVGGVDNPKIILNPKSN